MVCVLFLKKNFYFPLHSISSLSLSLSLSLSISLSLFFSFFFFPYTVFCIFHFPYCFLHSLFLHFFVFSFLVSFFLSINRFFFLSMFLYFIYTSFYTSFYTPFYTPLYTLSVHRLLLYPNPFLTSPPTLLHTLLSTYLPSIFLSPSRYPYIHPFSYPSFHTPIYPYPSFPFPLSLLPFPSPLFFSFLPSIPPFPLPSPLLLTSIPPTINLPPFQQYTYLPTYQVTRKQTLKTKPGKSQVNIRIPPCVANGEYLLRVEHIALHSASAVGGAQLYLSCAQISVSSGSGVIRTPGLVSFPGAYKATDPGIKFNLYYPVPTSYINPGPAVATC